MTWSDDRTSKEITVTIKAKETKIECDNNGSVKWVTMGSKEDEIDYQLVDGDGFGQIAWLIGIESFLQR